MSNTNMSISQFESTPSSLSMPADPFQALLGTDGTLDTSSVSPDSLMEMGEANTPSTSTRGTPQPTTEGDKKPAKKRKSWGQELPTPKTNLPPRWVPHRMSHMI